jgi:hypothetical protein
MILFIFFLLEEKCRAAAQIAIAGAASLQLVFIESSS